MKAWTDTGAGRDRYWGYFQIEEANITWLLIEYM